MDAYLTKGEKEKGSQENLRRHTRCFLKIKSEREIREVRSLEDLTVVG